MVSLYKCLKVLPIPLRHSERGALARINLKWNQGAPVCLDDYSVTLGPEKLIFLFSIVFVGGVLSILIFAFEKCLGFLFYKQNFSIAAVDSTTLEQLAQLKSEIKSKMDDFMLICKLNNIKDSSIPHDIDQYFQAHSNEIH